MECDGIGPRERVITRLHCKIVLRAITKLWEKLVDSCGGGGGGGGDWAAGLPLDLLLLVAFSVAGPSFR